jgi:hypothetical protein
MRVGVEQIQIDIDKFKSTQWTFDSTNVQKITIQLTPEDADIFLCDPKKVNTMQEAVTHLYGMQKYYLN